MYPVPHTEELFTKLQVGVRFIKLDVKDGYQQIELEEQPQGFATINSPKDLFQYTKLPFGVASTLAIFQHEIENLLGWS